MSTITIQKQVTMVLVECGGCGVPFCLSDSFISERRRDHKTWYCPNGCGRCYPAKNETEKLREELEKERAFSSRKISECIRLENDLMDAAKKAKRIHAGVCPCCNRTFQNLARHMATKHPEGK